MTMTARTATSAATGAAQELQPHIPVATYRFQFNRSFTFQDARRLVEYLHALGVSDAYASPYFRARPESTHGYDIANHNELNPAIGSEEDYNAFVEALHTRGMGQILDIVPNHMGIGESSNTWWMDVLENGPSSIYAPYFDIDWHPIKDELENKVLLPILGQQYGRVLENDEIKLRYKDGVFSINYWETVLPVNPRTYVEILQLQLDALIEQLGPEHEQVLEYQSIMTALTNLPLRTETERAKVIERRREKEIAKQRLAILSDQSPVVRQAIEQTVARFNGTPGDPRSYDLLDALINRQAYRLAYWRVAAEEINYRRFFDVNDLAAIRMENPEVFAETHRLVMRLLAEGKVNGLRLDHPDGLWDPAGYFRRLQESYAALFQPVVEAPRTLRDVPLDTDGATDAANLSSAALAATVTMAGDQTPTPKSIPEPPRSLYLLVEKILGRGEVLPKEWPVHGTTGYDFMTALNGVLVDTSAEKQMTDIYATFIDRRIRFDDLVYDTKKQIMSAAMASEINVLSEQLASVAEHNRYYRDFTLYSLRSAVREVVACFPVYRTYIAAETDEVSERDRKHIETAITGAKRRNPALDPSIYDFLRDILLLRYPDTLEPEARDAQRRFVMKFQQCTGPVMAKGLEDTAFYIYNRLVSLNEVGGEPQRFGISMSEFHRHNQARLRDWPAGMISTSTHDTKRSEDVRARISVLSEIPREWRAALNRWSRLNRRKKSNLDGQAAPDRNEEYLFYQTLLGAWPFFRRDQQDEQGHYSVGEQWPQFVERIQNYMIKAIREAKVNTSWLNPNNAYDEAVRSFVAAVLADRRFVDNMSAFQRKIAHYGALNSLSQTLLKLTSPGVPDIYQGNEMWDFSLVDPDNRRPVDYDLRKWLLAELINLPAEGAELARSLVNELESGRIKLYLTHRVLTFRREHADLYRAGSYTALTASGDAADHIIAFARSHARQQAITIAPRLLARRLQAVDALPLGDVWGDAILTLPGAKAGQTYRNICTDETIATIEYAGAVGLPLAEALANFPVALLELIG